MLYPVLIAEDEGCLLGASFVDVHVHSLGDTLQEALADCQDGFELALEDEDSSDELFLRLTSYYF